MKSKLHVRSFYILVILFFFLNFRVSTAAPSSATATPSNNRTQFLPPVRVFVRIEGENRTVFEGTILTNGHIVTPHTYPRQVCDGVERETNPALLIPDYDNSIPPGPVVGAALDDAARIGGFTWDGYTRPDIYGNIRFRSIAEYVNLRTELYPELAIFWLPYLNWKNNEYSDWLCHTRLKDGDEVLFAFAPWWLYEPTYKPIRGFLSLEVPGGLTVRKGERFEVRVRGGFLSQGMDKLPGLPGVEVMGAVTDADGRAWVSIEEVGTVVLKLEKELYIRSQKVVIECIE